MNKIILQLFNKLVCNIGYKITYAKSNIGQGYRLN